MATPGRAGRPLSLVDTASAGARALAAAATAGPYFAIQPYPGGTGWRPLRVLLADPEVLAERVGHARSVLARSAGCGPADIEPRVAASIVFLGLAARLVSPLLGAVVLAGVLPQLTVADLYWQPVPGGPWPLATRPVGGTTVGARPAEPLAVQMDALTGPLTEAFRGAFQLSGQVLRGNIASAVAGAAGMLASADPARAERAAELAAGIVAQPPLRGTGEFGPAGQFRRRSCCLFYRVPGAGLCGDCVLASRPARP